ncbi:uncharacterized protein ATNIH1004_000528 [Aspergillus tanneri]|uniref:Uncharacterized protein n=1 Tax=Aspergillus tanneri TaxID=1220188 RepID=A0A5M9NAT5_9EURO|nr:uncharacterized protein ATNIH1004_000528 [Aspergillus tanneri]KAA8651637.1 hypothetical protein ATNIH1004_000528 [Aspergillus tanneri]
MQAIRAVETEVPEGSPRSQLLIAYHTIAIHLLFPAAGTIVSLPEIDTFWQSASAILALQPPPGAAPWRTSTTNTPPRGDGGDPLRLADYAQQLRQVCHVVEGPGAVLRPVKKRLKGVQLADQQIGSPPSLPSLPSLSLDWTSPGEGDLWPSGLEVMDLGFFGEDDSRDEAILGFPGLEMGKYGMNANLDMY